MKLVTAAEMKNIDLKTIEEYGVPSLTLMERAGEKVAMNIEKIFRGGRITVVSGPGNNGGDGLVVSRLLFKKGYLIESYILAEGDDALSHDCKKQYQSAREAGVNMSFVKKLPAESLKNTLIVDAIFGTGLNKTVSGDYREAISDINKSGSPVLAVDIPSGISADSGLLLGEAVTAEYTVTFGLPKIGHYIHPGAEYAGKLFVEDIGFPEELTTSNELRSNIIDAKMISTCFKRRSATAHKGTYGHVFILAGSTGKTGAALLAAKACMRTGAGSVTLGVPESIFPVIQSRVLEEMTLPLPSMKKGTFSNVATAKALEFIHKHADVVLLGPGVGMNDKVAEFVREIILFSDKPLIVDADALNCVAGDTSLLRNTKEQIIITPHPGEMRRLLSAHRPSLSSRKIDMQRMEIAGSFALDHEIVCVLKGAPTVVASREGDIYLNTSGNPGMATAGSGDVLSGMIAALLAHGKSPVHAAICGAYLHGLAGDIAMLDIGETSMIAGDIIDYLPDAIRRITV